MPIDLIQFFAELITSIFKHGLSLTTLAVAVTALLRVQGIRKILTKRLPRRFRHEDKLESMQRDIRAIKEHLGVTECVERIDLSPNTGKPLLKFSHKGKLFVRLADVFTARESTTYLKRRKKKMLKKFTSRKFILAIAGCVVIILNDMLDLNVDKDTVFTFAGILATWIATEGVVDATRKTPEVTDAYTTPKDAGNVQDTAS